MIPKQYILRKYQNNFLFVKRTMVKLTQMVFFHNISLLFSIYIYFTIIYLKKVQLHNDQSLILMKTSKI